VGVNKLEIIRIYKEVLVGKKRKQFPKNFWQNDFEENRIIGDILLKFLFEEILGWSKDDICEKLNKNIFFEYKLNQVYKIIHEKSVFNTINSVYPDKFKPWDISCVKSVPMNYWGNEENVINAIKWLIENKLKWTDDEVIKNLSSSVFDDNKLSGLLDLFNGSPFKAIDKAYPNKFKMWQLKSICRNYWDDDNNIKDAILWLIDKKLGRSNSKLIFISMNDFVNNDLSSLFRYKFRCSSKLLLEKLKVLIPEKTFMFKRNFKSRYNVS